MKKAFSFWLGSLLWLEPSRKKELVGKLGSARAVYEASDTELVSCIGAARGKRLREEIRESKGTSCIEETYRKALGLGIDYHSVEEADFPEKLKMFPNDPYGLYTIGKKPDDSFRIAIVGARKATGYGLAMAKRLGRLFAEYGIPVISGMARGIDSTAQKSVLENDGATIAVLGSGINVCYPGSLRGLYDTIRQKGSVLSEYPPGTKPMPYYFPIRNRIIAALSDLVIVLEAGEKSGSLITAQLALDYGKDVYALPGRIDDPLSAGCNELIRQGAQILTSEEALFDDFCLVKHVPKQRETPKIKLAPEDDLLYSCVGLHPKSLETIQNEINCPADNLVRRLTALELAGYVTQSSPGRYVRL